MVHGEEARPDRTALGVGIILASVLTMAFADAVVKLVSANLTVWQVFFRSLACRNPEPDRALARNGR